MSWNEYVVGLQGNRRKVMVCLNIRTCIFLCFVSSYCGLVRDFVRRYKPEKIAFLRLLGSFVFFVREFDSYGPNIFNVPTLCSPILNNLSSEARHFNVLSPQPSLPNRFFHPGRLRFLRNLLLAMFMKSRVF